jgi:hypothetical protein
MKADTTRKSNAPQVRELKASELDAVAGAAVRYYVMLGTWWCAGRAGAVNTGIPAD